MRISGRTAKRLAGGGAVGLVNGVISLVLIISANRISKKRMGTGIW